MKTTNYFGSFHHDKSIRDEFIKQLLRVQKRDLNLRIIIKLLKKQDYELDNRERHHFQKGDEVKKLVVPKGLQAKLIEIAHDKDNFATKKTIEVFKSKHGKKYGPKVIHDCISHISQQIVNPSTFKF